MGHDRKYGRVTTERGSIGEDEPVVLFRAQDALLPALLDHYRKLCTDAGSPRQHLGLIDGTSRAVRQWQERNPTKVPTSDGAVVTEAPGK